MPAAALSSRLTDQYLPPAMRGFRDADIYPLDGPDLGRARALARGHTRSGKVLLYTVDPPHHLAFAQSIKQNLAKIGLDVQIKGIPRQAYLTAGWGPAARTTSGSRRGWPTTTIPTPS